jgi:septum formation protein
MTRRPVALVLASGSPRRSDLLTRAGLTFRVQPSTIEEVAQVGETARRQALRLAREKAEDVAQRLTEAGRDAAVLGADTLVVIDGEALGKPDDPAHAVKLLSRLVGRRHVVVTGVALVAGSGPTRSFAVESGVVMRDADEAEIRAYVAGGEPLDKAGAYAAQGDGRRFIERIEGSETNVIGLPMDETLALLREAGVDGA